MTAEDYAAVLAALDDVRETLAAIHDNVIVLHDASGVIVSLLSGIPFLLGCCFGGLMIGHFFRRI